MSFFRYAGGKSKLKDEIIKCLGNQSGLYQDSYIEPFFGGGSIGLVFLENKPNLKNIWINDKDIGISCLWTSVIRYTEEFKKLIVDFVPSVTAFHRFKKELLSLTEMPIEDIRIVDIGFKKLAIHQISYSGLGTKSGGPLGGENQKSAFEVPHPQGVGIPVSTTPLLRQSPQALIPVLPTVFCSAEANQNVLYY